MAAALGRSPSTLSREIGRNGGSRRYRAAAADTRAWKQALRPKPCKLALRLQLRNAVAAKLALEWSPQQIAGWLKRTHPENEALRVSHETIYRSLYVQTRGVLKKQLLKHLRTRRTIRRSRHATMKGKHLGQIPDAVSIAERPASIEDRAVPGHWEGDLLCGAKNSFIVTLVERHSRYVMLAKVPNRETQTVVNALIKQARKPTRRTLQVADLGSRQRARRPSPLHHGDRHRGLFLRSAKPLAARLKRKHQPAPAPVLPARNRSGAAFSGRTQQDRASAQRAGEKNPGLPNPS